MRKHNYFRTGVSLILAATMLCSQVAASDIPSGDLIPSDDTSMAAGIDVFSDGTDISSGSGTEDFTSGSTDESGLFSDASEPAVLVPDEDMITPPSVTAVLNAADVENPENTYDLHIEWNIQNAQDQSVSLALGMDSITYAALPEAMMADSEGICHVPAADGSGLPMMLSTDPQNTDRVLLTYDKTGDGQISADFTVSAGNIETDSVSTITAEWYDANAAAWTTAGQADLNWAAAAVSPEVSFEEDNTENMDETPTEEPEQIEEPGVEEEITPVEEPAVTDEPTSTEEAVPTEGITPTENPASAVNPAPTEIPVLSEETIFTEEEPVIDDIEEVGSADEGEGDFVVLEDEEDSTEDVENAIFETEEDEEAEESLDGEEEKNQQSDIDVIQNETENTDEYAARATAIIEGEPQTTGTMMRMILRAAVGSSVDLTDYITNATFDKTEVLEGKSIEVTIEYEIYASVLKNFGTTKLTYDIPEGINPNQNYAGTVYDGGGNGVGTYEITSDGKITINLNQSFIDSGNVINGGISFWSKLETNGTKDEEKIEYSFSETNNIKTEIIIKKQQDDTPGREEDKYDINVTKEYTYDSEQSIADYKVTIGTDDGTSGGITLEDTLNLPAGVTGSIPAGSKLVRKDAQGNETELGFDEYFQVTNEGKIVLKDENKKLPDLAAGCSYELTYKVDYSGLENLNQSIELKNKAHVSDQYHQSEKEVTIYLNHTYLSKKAYYDSSKDKIIWTISLNDFGGDLSGYTLSDVLKKDSAEISLPNEITMIEYPANGGSSKKYTIVLPFTFDSAGGNAKAENEGDIYSPTSRFEITYETDVSEVGFYSKYENTASLGGDGKDFSTGGIPQEVTHDKGVLSKKYVAPDGKTEETEDVEGDPNIKHYRWNATIVPPKDGIKANAIYTDTISAEPYSANNSHYITSEQLSGLRVLTKNEYDTLNTDPLSNDYYKIQVLDSSNTWVDFPDSSGDFTYTKFRIVFLQNIPKNYTAVVLDYKTTADLSGMKNGNTWNFVNTGEFEQDNGRTSSSDSKKVSSGGYIKKLDAGGNNGNYVYDDCKGVLYYAIVVNETRQFTNDCGNIVVKDILPEGTTLYQLPYNIREKNGIYGSVYGSIENDRIVKCYFLKDANQPSSMFCATGVNSGIINGQKVSGEIDINDYISQSYDPITRELTIEIPGDLLWLTDNGEDHSTNGSYMLYIFYAAQIDSKQDSTSENLYTNKAEIYINGEKKAEDSVTDTVVSSYVVKNFNGQSDNSSRETSYQVVVNPSGAVLDGGTDINLVDSITYDKYMKAVDLKENSIHLYKLTSSGKGAEIDKSLYTVQYGEKTDSAGNKKFEMEIYLKDGQPYILEYTYVYSIDDRAIGNDVADGVNFSTVTGEDGKTYYVYDITNSITVEGSRIGSDDSEVVDEKESNGSSAYASTKDVTLVKVDEDNAAVTLRGAEFRLEEYEGELNNTNWRTDNANWVLVKENLLTGEEGTLKLTGLEANRAYRLVETKAPTNYICMDEPYYFYLSDSRITAMHYPEGYPDVAQEIKSGYITIKNKKGDETKTSIAVQKEWYDENGTALSGEAITDKDGNIINSIQATLYQTTNENDTENGVVYTSDGLTNPATLSVENGWYALFGDLPKDNGEEVSSPTYKKYYYYVKEEADATLNDGSEVPINDTFIMESDQNGTVVGGTVTLKNSKGASVSVKKIWDASTGGVHPEIPVTLYRSKSGVVPEREPEEIENCTVNVNLKYETSWDSGVKGVFSENIQVGASAEIKVIDVWQSSNSQKLIYSGISYTGSTEVVDYQVSWGTKKADVTTYKIDSVVENMSLDLTIGNSFNDGDYVVEIKQLESPADTRSWLLPSDKNQVETINLGSEYASKSTETGYYSATGWEYTWNKLDGDFYYYVLEGTDGSGEITGYKTAYSYDVKDPDAELKKVEKVTITNSSDDEGEKTSITVNKVWDDNITDHSNYTVKAKLYQKAEGGEDIQIGEEVTLANINGVLSYTWSVPKGPEYYVVETVAKIGEVDVLESYTVTYSNTILESAVEDAVNASVTEGTITITNTGETTEISVKKKWVSANGIEKISTTLPDIKVQLYKQGEDGKAQPINDVIKLGSTHNNEENYGDAGWSYTWKNLPKGSYYVEEVEMVEDYSKVTYQLEVSDSTGGNSPSETSSDSEDESLSSEISSNITTTGGTIVIINHEDSTEISVEKIWDDNNPTGKPDVTVRLYRTITPLQALAPTPTVEPIATPTPTVEPIATPTPIPTDGNRIEVNVYSWNGDVNGIPCDNEDVYVEVFIRDTSWNLVGTAILRSSNGWTDVVVDSNGGTDQVYKLTDAKIHPNENIITEVLLYHDGNGYKPQITGSGIINVAISYSGIANANLIDNNVSVKSILSEPETAVLLSSASSDLVDIAENLILTVDGIELQTSNAEYMGAGIDKVLGEGNGWKADWSDLDKTDENGNLYYYYAVEEEVSGYSAEYNITYKDGDSEKGIDKVTITNTKDEIKTSITVQKKWSDEVESHEGYTAEVTLYDAAGNPVVCQEQDNPIVLDNNQWSYTWNDLPEGYYYVVETKAQYNGSDLTNYTTTYRIGDSNEVSSGKNAKTSDGTIIITNTRNKAGITLPGTGSKYPFVFYGLGCAFLLISAAWMLLTFKKRNTPIDAGKGGKRSEN
ncbi:MAG: Cna B-type domain-containing protein [Eubacteriales bacterium]|nr:Cna B-type domain-containing protein [Eubacteriales bacterium]